MRLSKVIITGILVLGVFLFLLYYCIPKREDYFVDTIENYSYIPKGEGISFGLVSNDRKGTIEERNFILKSTELLNINLLLANGTKASKDFLIIPIIDYSQGSLVFKKKTHDNLKITLSSNETTFLPVSFENFTKGNHDIVLLIVKDPDNVDLSEEYRKSTELNHVLAIKMNILVESDEKPMITSFLPGTVDNDVLDGVFLSKNDELRRWLVEESKGNENIEYTVQVGNTQKEEFPYAIMTLMNWKVIHYSNGESAIFGKVQPGKRNLYVDKISKLDNQVNNFTTILIPYPYEKVDRFNQMKVEPSSRVAIIK